MDRSEAKGRPYTDNNCQAGNIYCRLVEIVGEDPVFCIYNCYDKNTSVFCYAFTEVC